MYAVIFLKENIEFYTHFEIENKAEMENKAKRSCL